MRAILLWNEVQQKKNPGRNFAKELLATSKLILHRQVCHLPMISP